MKPSVLVLIAASFACSGSRTPETPRETFKPLADCGTTGCTQTVYPRPEGQQPYRGFAIDDRDVYWQEIVIDRAENRRLRVLAAPKDGSGPIRELGEWGDFQAAEALVVDATHVHWLKAAKLVRVAKDGSGAVELTIPDVTSLDPGPLHDAGDAILVGGQGCQYLASVPKDGTTGKVWRVSQRQVTGGDTGVDVDGDRYYCASGNHVFVLDTTSGKVEELANYRGRAGAMQKVGADLYWIDTDNPDTRAAALVQLRAAAAPVAIGPAHGGTGSLMHDAKAERLYWITGVNNRNCEAVVHDLKSKQTSLLAEDLDRYGNSAQDADFVYWAGSRAIMRVRK